MAKVFDYVIVTVANQFQKDYLEAKLSKRDLQKGTEYKILIENKKVGSGRCSIEFGKTNENRK